MSRHAETRHRRSRRSLKKAGSISIAFANCLHLQLLHSKRIQRWFAGLIITPKPLWEVTAGGLGSQNAIGGGGRYDNLVEHLGGRATPGVGFGSGLERLLIALESQGVALPDHRKPLAWIVAQNDAARGVAWQLLGDLRKANIAADMDLGGRNMKGQFKLADRESAKWCVILGENRACESDRGVERYEDRRADQRADERTGGAAQRRFEHPTEPGRAAPDRTGTARLCFGLCIDDHRVKDHDRCPPPPPLRRLSMPRVRRRISGGLFRRVSVVTVLLAFVVSGWWWVPPAWRNLRLVYWQHKCMNYEAPTGQVVYDPKQLTRVIPAEWSSFYGLCSPPGFRSGRHYLHARITQTGRSEEAGGGRLHNCWSGYSGSDRCVFTRVFSSGTLISVPKELSGKFYLLTHPSSRVRERSFKVLSGSLDATDPTHFTFRVLHVGAESNFESTYDGWLQNDDRVAIGERRSVSAPK